ncbi:hypothetical protein [Pedobacter duraquae]|uniref:Uncharacterized protein n=1 Tax=Pedobacter duraquae TaxID=425511 RepID=A0A4R6IBX0_9SPHI|nr:hypothetical protein [Pedobacter duraquae]TDO19047.1 hypothetical protein CLV32_4669 [Pedobacter duraquae]
MAKDIKAIQCPKCGSVNKQEIKPEFYRCQNCGTEYFLDNDDKHIYHHHERIAPATHSFAPTKSKTPIYILLGMVLLIVVVYFGGMVLRTQKISSYTDPAPYQMPRSYYNSFVYTNTATGDPVYLRMGTDYIDKGNDKSELEVHAQFNNVLDGKLLSDHIIKSGNQGKDNCSLSFRTFAPDLILAVGCSDRLFKIDTKTNELINVTKSMFADFPELGSGVARIEFDYTKPMINIMTNDGKNYNYFPQTGKLIADATEADKYWKSTFDRHDFTFGYLGDYFDEGKESQLIENSYVAKTRSTQRRNLTPGRKYFNPQILHQDGSHLLIVVTSTAATNSPIIVQSINVQTGKLEWALPPDNYTLSSASKCKQGFAIEYRKDDDADYVHGALVISEAGKLVRNYQLSRLE